MARFRGRRERGAARGTSVTLGPDQLWTIIERTPEAVIAGTGDGAITAWNDAAEGLFGWTSEEAVGRHLSLLIPPGHAAVFEERSTDLADGEVVRSVVPRVRRDGSVFQAEVTLAATRTARGAVAAWVSVVRDVTRDRLVADACAAIGSTFDPAMALATLLDRLRPETGITALTLFEADGERVEPVASAGRTSVRPGPSRASGSVARALRAGNAVLETQRDEWVVVFPAKQRTSVVAALRCSGTGVPPSLATIDSLEAVVAAITQDLVHMLLYRRQQQTVRKLEELDELKSTFVSTVSHELRTPLTTIAGFAETLRERWSGLSEDARLGFVDRIATRSTELTDMIDQLLDFAHVERGGYAVDLRIADLATELEREVRRLEPTLHRHTVRLDVPPGLPVFADPRALRRVVENLLTNAAKFSQPDAEIRVDAIDTGAGEIVVRVADDGIGIAADQQTRIFDRFYRVHRGDRVTARGTGIGLAVARQFVEAQGGRIWVLSAPGRGSTFSFTLRLARPSGVISQGPAAADAPAPSSSPPRGQAGDGSRPGGRRAS